MQFITTNDEYPDWHDNGKKVEAEINGRLVTGEICIDDVVVDDDGEETPLIKLLMDNGESIYFCDLDKYRFIG